MSFCVRQHVYYFFVNCLAPDQAGVDHVLKPVICVPFLLTGGIGDRSQRGGAKLL